MANLRVVFDNAADRATTISATSSAGTLLPTNMKTDFKSEVWRSTSVATQIITLTWPTAELINMVALAFCNISSIAHVTVYCYTLASDPSATYISPSFTPTSGADLGSLSWGGQPLGVNAFSYGGGAYASMWLQPGSWQKIAIRIDDTANAAGFIEAARLIVGNYWSPTYTAEAGTVLGILDTSKTERTDAGDLRTDRGTLSKTMSLDLNYLTNSDRNTFLGLMRNGLSAPIYLSLTPESTDDIIGEQAYTIYGKMSKSPSLKYNLLNQFSTSLEIEEI